MAQDEADALNENRDPGPSKGTTKATTQTHIETASAECAISTEGTAIGVGMLVSLTAYFR